MRKFTVVFLFLILFTTIITASVGAAEYSYADDIKIYVNGNVVNTGKPPVISNSRTLAPIRPIAEACGITVGWDGTSREAKLYGGVTDVTLKIDSTNMKVYNSIIDEITTVKLDTAPVILDSSTYITVRAAMEALGVKVEWDDASRSIHLTSSYIQDTQAAQSAPTASSPTIDSTKPAQTTNQTSSSDNEKSSVTAPKEDSPIAEPSFAFTDFRKMENDTIIKSAPHGLYGRIKSDQPITMVRCRITGTKMDYSLYFKKEDNLKNYNIFTYFDKLMCFSDAGIGEHTLEIYAAANGGQSKKVYSYTYTVITREQATEQDKKDNTSSDKPSDTTVPPEQTTTPEVKEPANTQSGKENTPADTTVKEEDKNTSHADDKKKDDDEDVVVAPEADKDIQPDVPDVALSYYGFQKMTNDKIAEGAPHGLYGNVVSNYPITFVRCRISGTDIDYSVAIPEKDNVTTYNVFTYFDKLIRFSDAGLGKQKFEIFVGVAGNASTKIFKYSYTVVKAETVNEEAPKNEETKPEVSDPNENTKPDSSSKPDTKPSENIESKNDKDQTTVNNIESTANGDVCLPLEGAIRVTSPYGFRAYNKWEFHKGVDIVSSSLNIIAVADGEVVDCATGRNSGVGNYVAIRHNGGWVSLYYHLASYDVEIGDNVKMGEKFATMGNTGGNYGVHLHFMACDSWYGSLWETQNNHHKPPHEYVPQLLHQALYYTPCFESKNTDKVIISNFHFPSTLKQGTAYAISNSSPRIISQNPLASMTLAITDASGNVVLSETMKNPEYYVSGGYTYTSMGINFDEMCEFDTIPAGDMKISVSAVTNQGRERVLYIKDFTVTPTASARSSSDKADIPEDDTKDTDAADNKSVDPTDKKEGSSEDDTKDESSEKGSTSSDNSSDKASDSSEGDK